MENLLIKIYTPFEFLNQLENHESFEAHNSLVFYELLAIHGSLRIHQL